MNSVTVSDLKARLSEFLRRVRDGERLLVTDRGTPVAIVSPLDGTDLPNEMNDLVERGLVRLPPRTALGTGTPLKRPEDPSGRLAAAVEAEREAGW